MISNGGTITERGLDWKPVWRHDCELGHDKALSIGEVRDKAKTGTTEPLIIFIGDGISDLPAAHAADILFARKGLELERHCLEHGIEHVVFDTFADIQEVLSFVLNYLRDTYHANNGTNETTRPWRMVSHKNKMSFAISRAQCQLVVRTPKETAAPAA